jgi:hypothetical protein
MPPVSGTVPLWPDSGAHLEVATDDWFPLDILGILFA